MTTLAVRSPRPLPADTASRWWLAPLALASLIVLAGDLQPLDLPESYRTPLADIIYEDQASWRAPEKEENPWRSGQDGRIPDARLKSEILPHYDYSQREQPTSRNLFQNENERARPQTNIFRYNF